MTFRTISEVPNFRAQSTIEQTPMLPQNWKAALIVGIVLAALSVIALLASMIYLIVTGVPLCSLNTPCSWVFLSSIALSMLSIINLMCLHTAALCKIKAHRKVCEENFILETPETTPPSGIQSKHGRGEDVVDSKKS